MSPLTRNFLGLLLLALLPGALFAQENRLALIIGNSNYEDTPLNNPINDANDMAEALENLGFTVILRTDADRREMGRAIRDFGRQLKQDRGVGLFYYAGHGMQIDNRNYLIPVGTPLEEEDEVPYESVDVGSVLAKMESAGNALNLIILDACRNNPFPGRFRSGSRGLARVQAPIGSLVVYATAPGAVADDGEGRNGVFTGALLEQLREGGQSLTQTIRRTRAAVVEATNGRQVPWESSSLLKDYFFTEQPNDAVAYESQSDTQAKAPAAPGTDELDTLAPSAVETQPERLAQNTGSNDTREPLPEPQDGSDATDADNDDQPIEPLALVDTTINDQERAPATQTEKPAPIVESKTANTPAERSNETGTATLTVNVEPADARVRIMNIVDKYTPGISLDKSREYDVYVTHRGYTSFRQNISLNENDTILSVTLSEKQITEPDMVAVTGGPFRMGCSQGDKLCKPYEKPAHTVTVEPFQIAVTEVTVAQFDQFVSSTGYVTDAEKNGGDIAGCFVWSDSGGISRSAATWGWDKRKNWRNPGYQQSPTHPVTCVSWNDAHQYAKWLAIRTQRNYDLPTEAEWELAARANSSGAYGRAKRASQLCAFANVADKTQSPTGSKWGSKVDCKDSYWFSAPVATYQANGFGVFDMQGNAWEWVSDVWSDSLTNTPSDGRANTTGKTEERVLRGGGWDGDAKRVRLSSRSKSRATGRASMTGFRLVVRGY